MGNACAWANYHPQPIIWTGATCTSMVKATTMPIPEILAEWLLFLGYYMLCCWHVCSFSWSGGRFNVRVEWERRHYTVSCSEGCGLHHNSIGSKFGIAFICACALYSIVHSMLLVVFSPWLWHQTYLLHSEYCYCIGKTLFYHNIIMVTGLGEI